MADRFSVIIPTLNEEDNIAWCIRQVRAISRDVEIIVADGGSTDLTVKIAREQGVIVCSSGVGRGKQCNAGAKLASGNILVFLHTDTRLPSNAFDMLESIFQHEKVKIGTFRLSFDTRHWLLWLHSLPARLNLSFVRFGDQCMVIRKSLFSSLGGFTDWRLFEDSALMQKASKETRIYRFPAAVVTSARRFRQNGLFRQQLRNYWYIALYLAGVSPNRLAVWYERGNRRLGATSLLIFTRFPYPGRVKTRLAKSVGEGSAAEFYRLFAENAFQESRQLSHLVKRYIFYADEEDRAEIRSWAGAEFRFVPQRGNNLGERLRNAFGTVFSDGAQKAVVVASDVPDLSSAILNEAIQALDSHDIVIGPCFDGGYYLLGMKKLYKELFDGISWSTSQVYQQTLNVIKKKGLTVRQLECLADIDTEEDLRRWSSMTDDGPNAVRTFIRTAGIVGAELAGRSPAGGNHHDFQAVLDRYDLRLPPVSIETLWVNVTRLCNQACAHCHVDASPGRTEQMSRNVIERCLEILAQNQHCRNLDITGGAPELNPDFDYFVIQARKLNKHVIVRHNLTVIFDGNPQTGGKKTYLPDLFAEQGVEVLASFPHYKEYFTDSVRGAGVFNKSIEGVRRLNALGYGRDGSGLILNLVYNSGGPVLPSERLELEAEFKQELLERYGLSFNKLYAVTNMPINRFYSRLRQSGEYDEYMGRLIDAFSPEAAKEVVCRSLVSIGYDGRIYDCDFNQMLNLPVVNGKPLDIFNFDFESLLNRRIRFGSHCFGCTAGGGGS